MITYNGEIYNYRELRDELSDRWRFRTRSDTEVILAAYDRWGVDCLDHLRGMFAFAIWDERRKKLFCARDRFGIKPFYWAEVGDGYFSHRRSRRSCHFCRRSQPSLWPWLNI